MCKIFQDSWHLASYIGSESQAAMGIDDGRCVIAIK